MSSCWPWLSDWQVQVQRAISARNVSANRSALREWLFSV